MSRTPGLTPFERRVNRYLAAGAFTARHWRGVLLSIYLLLVALFGLLAWFGAARDNSFALGAGVIGALALLLRFPRRLTGSMRAVSKQRRLERKHGVLPPPQRRP